MGLEKKITAKSRYFCTLNRALLIYDYIRWSGDIKNVEPEKCGGLEWFMLDDLPEKIVPYAKEAIKHYLAGVNFSHYGW